MFGCFWLCGLGCSCWVLLVWFLFVFVILVGSFIGLCYCLVTVLSSGGVGVWVLCIPVYGYIVLCVYFGVRVAFCIVAGLAGRLFGECACFCLGVDVGEFPHGGVSGEEYCCQENGGFGHLGVLLLGCVYWVGGAGFDDC